MEGSDALARDDGRGPRLLRRATTARADGEVAAIDLASTGWEYLTFHAYRLRASQAVHRPAVVGDRHLGRLGSRASVFDGPPPPLVLIEPGLDLKVVAATDSLIAIAAAPGGSIHRTAVIAPGDVHKHDPRTGRSRPGSRSSTSSDSRKPQGVAFTRIYTADRSLDEALVPTDGDIVAVPRGYHTVGVPAGYDGYYLNVMAGPSRAWQFTVDPDHAWLMDWDPAKPGINPPER